VACGHDFILFRAGGEFLDINFLTMQNRLLQVPVNRAQFQLIHIESGFKADIYPLHIWALPRSTRIIFGDASIPVAPVEYLIIRKLEYFREGGSQKHLRDIQGILRNSPSVLNSATLQQFIRKRGLARQWSQAVS
jgi:hypothetical protein